MDNIADVILDGEGINNYFGISVSSAGDVNGDGYDDVIVGADYYSGIGRAYLYYGGNSMDNIADVILDGDSPSNFGRSVSGAGDVNGDGYDDVIVGAYRYNSNSGRAYIFYGGSSMDNIADVTLYGTCNLGISVSGAGDVNNDGYDDVIVGAYSCDFNTGRAFIYYGGNSMDNTADLSMEGEPGGNNFFGYSVSSAGDVNNDGYGDVVVGAYGYNSNTGRAYVYYGGSSMDNVADVTITGEGNGNYFGYFVSNAIDANNDGYGDVVVGAYGYNSNTGRAYVYYGESSMDNVADVTITGEGTGNHFGRSVSGAGDVNNDGYDDVIVGAYEYPNNGKVYIYSEPNAPLPVELVSFIATKVECYVVLEWETTTEINNYGFEVLRSVRNGDYEFETIGFVKGAGNSNLPNTYSFTDENPPIGKVKYRLKQINIDGNFELSNIVEVEISLPTEFNLFQNYPNPFNPTTVISFELPERSSVNLLIFNAVGQKVEELINEEKAPGYYKINFDANNLSSGVYLYKLKATSENNTFIQLRKMILVK